MSWFALRREPPLWAQVALGGGLLVALLLVWMAVTAGDAAEQRVVTPTILPSPGEVVGGFDSLLNDRGLVKSIFATLRRVFLGFGLAVVVGVPLGMAAGAWRPLSAES